MKNEKKDNNIENEAKPNEMELFGEKETKNNDLPAK